MSAVSGEMDEFSPEQSLPLLAHAETSRPLFWLGNHAIDSAQFLAHTEQVRAWLPADVPVMNLCNERYDFAVVFAAVVANGQYNLLPPSRAPQAIADVRAAYPHSVAIAGSKDCALPPACSRMPAFQSARSTSMPRIPAAQIVAIGHTSGSTGKPTAHRKRWGQLLASNARNMAVLSKVLGDRFQVVATVPAQHMYGLELSLLLPFGGAVSVASERPFFAADVVARIEALPGPRALVTTPLHLRTLLDAGIAVPPLQAIVSATAPLPSELAHAAEKRFGAVVIEAFGSTETCVIAHRLPARETIWTLHDGVELGAQPDGTRVTAPWLPDGLVLADLVDQPDARHFHLRGRHADLLEIAGKRASLADLNRRLLAIPGVEDGVIVQTNRCNARGAQRLAALVVAPDLSEQSIVDKMRPQMDPVFLPRPVHRVECLPRNAIGKLPRARLLKTLEELNK